MFTELEEKVKIKTKIDYQTVYINIDDSGKMSTKEKIAVYGGIVFLNKKEKDKFITQYKSIINEIKCKYCVFENDYCDNSCCPELKHSNLKNNHIRRIINYIKKYMVVACVINNGKIYSHIINDKAAKGRYSDYALRRTIKGIILNLIKNGRINPLEPLKIILNIDEQSTKTNGYYNLKDGLMEELKYGIINFNYSKKHEPVIFGALDIELSYQKSDKSYVVQAADLVAGTVRKKVLQLYDNPTELYKNLEFVDYKIFLP